MHALQRAVYPRDKNPIGRANGTKPGVIAGDRGEGGREREGKSALE